MDDKLEPLKPDEAVEWYLEEKSLEYANSTILSHRSRLGHFLKWCNEQGITNLNDLTGRKLKRYRAWRQQDGDLAKPSLKSQIDTIRVFISWCETIDAVPHDLSTKVVSPSLNEVENVRVVMVEHDQAEQIFGYLQRI